MTARAVLLIGSLLLSNSAMALEMYPPWIHSTPKRKSPSGPPWVKSKCHQKEVARGGVWAYPLDWREVDWSQADSGRHLHMQTQAISLAVDQKLRGDKPIPQRDAILEYYRDPPLTGPGRIVDKSEDGR